MITTRCGTEHEIVRKDENWKTNGWLVTRRIEDGKERFVHIFDLRGDINEIMAAAEAAPLIELRYLSS